MFAFIKTLFSAKKPNAALAWQQAGNDAAHYYWLYAAPVHLVLQRDSFSLGAQITLNEAEADALTATFNQHFAADGKVFFWHVNTFFLRLNNNPNIQTQAPPIGKDINAFLPTGDGAIDWASFTNELQMLLFTQPINQAREAENLPVINSLWCYSGGQL